MLALPLHRSGACQTPETSTGTEWRPGFKISSLSSSVYLKLGAASLCAQLLSAAKSAREMGCGPNR